MKTLLICLVVLLFIVGGCFEEQKAQRAALEQRFREAYPNDWKAKLLEYDNEQTKIGKEQWQQTWRDWYQQQNNQPVIYVPHDRK